MSRGRVQTRPLRQTESTPQLGHAEAASSAVTTCTTRPPNASDATWTVAPLRHSMAESNSAGTLTLWRAKVWVIKCGWRPIRRWIATHFVLSQCAVRDLNPEPADSDYSVVD